MQDTRFHEFLHRQIPVLVALSLVPGLAYIFLGWLHAVFMPAVAWYLIMLVTAAWGIRLYRSFDAATMSETRREQWYAQCVRLVYAFFVLWALIFLIYVRLDAYKLHYIAIFTEIGASVVASSLLASDKRLFRPTILVLMIPLIVYFMLVGEWYAYVLALFSTILTWVLLYAAQSTNNLLTQTRHQATHDALSGLFNRQYFIEHLQRRMNSLNESGEHGYLLLIDLDHFKTVNDTLGHDVGDHLLQGVVERLLDNLADHCVVARLGGDEFIVTGGSFSERDACEAEALETARRLLVALKTPYVVGAHQLHISASIGVSVLGPGDSNANRFIKEADIAMYEVKARGRDGVFVFDEAIARRVEGDLEIERLLPFALSRGEITLHYQPQVDRAGRIIGAEALVRWTSPTLGVVPPDRFVPIAEQTGLIIELGRHILETAFRTLGDWSRDGITLQQFSVNISMRQFTHPGFAAQVEELLRRHLDPALIQTLMFEITETVVTEDIDGVIQTMQELKALGIRFSMDDFGTGYSSLSHLNRLPLDELKVDRAFVLALGDDESDRALVVTILNMASLLGLNTVAEGVETAAQHAFLMHHGCGMFQGYFHSKPLAKEAFELFIQDHATARDAI